MDYKSLRLGFEGAVARLTIATGGENLLDRPLLSELREAAAAIDARDDVVVALLSADGADFCAGWAPATRTELAQQRLDPVLGLLDPFGPIAMLRCPVVAAVQGRVLSAGLELALSCDIRIAADDATFGMPDVLEGHMPLAGGSQRLPRAVGKARALAMLLGGEPIDAATASRAGLVSRVVPRSELAEAAEEVVRRIGERGPIALRYAKEAVHRGVDLPLDQALRYETDLSIILQTTADRDEGVRAFFEKRPPNFEGR